MRNLFSLKPSLESTDAYVPIKINDFVNYEQRQSVYELMRSIREAGFPEAGIFGRSENILL